METELSEADWIAAQIEKSMGGVRSFSIDSGMSDGVASLESVSFSDFAVLCRSAFMFDPIIKALNDHGIAFQVVENTPFYQKEPFSSVLRRFRFLCYQAADDSGMDQEQAKIYRMIMDKESVSSIIRVIMSDKEAPEDAITRLTGLADRYNNDYDNFFRALSIRRGFDDFNPGVERVSLMTIHAAKGLEFKQVFIPGCEEGIIPFELFGNIGDDAAKEEERLFYVGITRTEYQLYLTWAKKRAYKGRILKQERSRFLDRLEKDLLEIKRRDSIKKNKGHDGQMELFKS